ncbi:MAG: SDR family oxidoreductase [Novosphingobium sp.]|nr:SDR family oxidoreductase [Novosphingobium sp.]
MTERNDFSGKVAIVTAGASGMGAAAARLLAERGGQVVIVDIDEAGGKALADELGENAVFSHCDVADQNRVTAVVDEVFARHGRLDCLFNNAGFAVMKLTQDLADEDWGRVIDISLNSVFYFSRAAIPCMKANGGGAIVNTASVSGMRGDYMMAAYNAAKGGVLNYTRAMACDHADDNIRVNAICPGLIWDTAMTSHLAGLPGGWEPWKASIPMRRGGNAIEVARAMIFLASDEASYITGAELAVDGGLTAHTGFPDLRPVLMGLSNR